MDRRRLRVLHLIQNLNYGGMERLLADIVLRSDPAAFEHHVLVLQYLGRFSQELEGIATLHVSGPLPRWSLIWPRRLARQIAAIAPDVVHTHSGVWLKATRAARLAGVPRILHTEHGRRFPDPWFARLVDGLASRSTDVVVAVSELLAHQLETTIVRGRARIAVVQNGVDVERHRPRPDSGAIRRELGIPPNAAVLGSIGRLESIKGYDIMVRAFARLLSGLPSAQPSPFLVLAGDGSQRAALEGLVDELDIADQVRFLGWRDDVEALLATFTLFCMSSRSEGTSVSLLEAMSSGLCPVVTRVGGNPAVLGSGLAHRLVDPEDPDALAAAMRHALNDRAALAADAQAARSRVLESWNLDSMVRRYQSLYAGDG